jgi:hypothetical protein
MTEKRTSEYWIVRLFNHPYPRKMISEQDDSILETGIRLIDDEYLSKVKAHERPIIIAIRDLMELELAKRSNRIA